MCHHLCGPLLILLMFRVAAVLPKRFTYRIYLDSEGTKCPHIECTLFTAGTARVSIPVSSPGFRSSGSGTVQRAAFAIGVPPDIYAFHRYTRNSTLLSGPQARQYPVTFHG